MSSLNLLDKVAQDKADSEALALATRNLSELRAKRAEMREMTLQYPEATEALSEMCGVLQQMETNAHDQLVSIHRKLGEDFQARWHPSA